MELSYNLSVEQGLKNASEMIKAGASAVKLEGCNEHILSVVKRCVESGIPVLGHLGLTPQLLNTLGGYKIQGKTVETIESILESAKNTPLYLTSNAKSEMSLLNLFNFSKISSSSL